jgi:hypothetical protein
MGGAVGLLNEFRIRSQPDSSVRGSEPSLSVIKHEILSTKF